MIPVAGLAGATLHKEGGPLWANPVGDTMVLVHSHRLSGAGAGAMYSPRLGADPTFIRCCGGLPGPRADLQTSLRGLRRRAIVPTQRLSREVEVSATEEGG